MPQKYKIKKVTEKPFRGDDGEDISYFWYRALRLSDNTTIQFGSTFGGLKEGETYDLEIEKYERVGGRLGYRDVTDRGDE